MLKTRRIFMLAADAGACVRSVTYWLQPMPMPPFACFLVHLGPMCFVTIETLSPLKQHSNT